MNKNDKIYIAGHHGLVGSSILKLFKSRGFKNLICRSHREVDLINTVQTEAFFRRIIVLEYNQRFEGSNDDKRLKDKLKSELPQ